jgi:hypothetical protein
MSKLSKLSVLLVIAAALLAACSPLKSPVTNNPYAPQAGDTNLVRDGLEIVKMEVVRSAGISSEAMLNLSYFLPTPCHQFRITASAPDRAMRITVDAYSLMGKDQVCALMRLATPSKASLNLGSFPAGNYTVWVNGKMAGEITAP